MSLPQVYTTLRYSRLRGLHGLPNVEVDAVNEHRRLPWQLCIAVSVEKLASQAFNEIINLN